MIATLPSNIETAPYGADELLLVNLDTLAAVRLNCTGAMIIGLARSDLTLNGVVDTFAQWSGSSPDEAGRVVCDYLNRMTASGWLLAEGGVRMSHDTSGAASP